MRGLPWAPLFSCSLPWSSVLSRGLQWFPQFLLVVFLLLGYLIVGSFLLVPLLFSFADFVWGHTPASFINVFVIS